MTDVTDVTLAFRSFYMKVGQILSVPNDYSHYGRIVDQQGNSHTVEKGDMPDNAQVGDQYAYKVEIWGNDAGLAYDLKKD